MSDNSQKEQQILNAVRVLAELPFFSIIYGARLAAPRMIFQLCNLEAAMRWQEGVEVVVQL